MEIVIEWRDGLVEVVNVSEASAGLGPGARTAAIGGRMSRSEMNDTSQTANCGTNGRSAAVSARQLKPSFTHTRGSARRRGWNWP